MPRPKVPNIQSHTREIAESLERERPDLALSNYLYLLYVERLGRILDTVDDRSCRANFGISGADMRVLFALRRSGPDYALRPTQLFRALLVTSGAVTKQVDRLEAARFVDRMPGPTNSGGFLIHLTEKGRRTADNALNSLADPKNFSATALSRRERDLLCDLSEKLLLALEQQLEETKERSQKPGRPTRTRTPLKKRTGSRRRNA